MESTPKAHRRPAWTAHLTIAALAVGTLVRCDCEEIQFIPGAEYTPPALDFGEVSVSSQETIGIQVLSSGSAGYIISALNLDADAEKFIVVMDEALGTGLSPSQTATISVTYRPCPAAWNGNVLKDPFDYNTCPGNPDSGDMNITDNSREQARRITLSGVPVQPPVAQIYCPAGVACGNEDPNLIECNGIQFGDVNAGETPCDLIIEVRNSWRNDKPVGALIVERMEVRVRLLGGTETRDGAQAGFSILDLAGNPLSATPESPFRVPIVAGTDEGTARFKLRFNGSVPGLWRGERSDMTGLRLYTSDPDKRIATAPITASGSSPDISVFPSFVDFGPVEQGSTVTSTVRVSNDGNATLRITDMRVESGNGELVITNSTGQSQPAIEPFSPAIQMYITYTPRDTGSDVERLLIASNDPDENPFTVNVRGGAIPTLRVDPPDTLVFPLSDPPPPMRRECFRLSNVGYGDLLIQELDIVDSDGTRTGASIDDFSIDQPAACATLPCAPNLTLCPPSLAGCTTSNTDVCVVYRNNDISQTDLANLVIKSNDPSDPAHTLVLNASDNPCFPPIAQIEVLTPQPCMGRTLEVTASMSNAGGPIGGTANIVAWNWFWLFAPGTPPAFSPGQVETVMFTPAVGGTYFLGLNVTNSCGASSQPAATEMINVSDICPN